MTRMGRATQASAIKLAWILNKTRKDRKNSYSESFPELAMIRIGKWTKLMWMWWINTAMILDGNKMELNNWYWWFFLNFLFSFFATHHIETYKFKGFGMNIRWNCRNLSGSRIDMGCNEKNWVYLDGSWIKLGCWKGL